MQRRTFLKAAGVAGIVAAGRAPAFAQGTKLHIVRWVDFIPEADVELKRQAPEASKALGAEVTFEFINANDLQPRITDRKSTRLNSSHGSISYAVFCLKKKKKQHLHGKHTTKKTTA